MTSSIANLSSEDSALVMGIFSNETLVNRTDNDGSLFIEFRDGSRFWVQRVLVPFIVMVGVFGNAVTIVVLTRRGMRSSTNTYLTALAVADILYLMCILWLSLMHYQLIHHNQFTFYWYTWPYALWLTDASTNTSVWLTVSFTVERYIAVCHPMRGKILCTESRARRVILAVFLFCFTATLTTPFEWTVHGDNNSTKPHLGRSWLGGDETYRVIYYWFTCITFVLLPLTLLIIFNTFLIQSVQRSKRLRRVMTCEDRAARSEVRITITLIAVVALFLICQLPTAATLIYTSFYEPPPNSDEEALLLGLGNIFNFLVSVNAASNFVLYCALSDKYLRVFLWTFCRCIYPTSSPAFSTSVYCNGINPRRSTVRVATQTRGSLLNARYGEVPQAAFANGASLCRTTRSSRGARQNNRSRSTSLCFSQSPYASRNETASRWWQRRASSFCKAPSVNSNVQNARLETSTSFL